MSKRAAVRPLVSLAIPLGFIALLFGLFVYFYEQIKCDRFRLCCRHALASDVPSTAAFQLLYGRVYGILKVDLWSTVQLSIYDDRWSKFI